MYYTYFKYLKDLDLQFLAQVEECGSQKVSTQCADQTVYVTSARYPNSPCRALDTVLLPDGSLC